MTIIVSCRLDVESSLQVHDFDFSRISPSCNVRETGFRSKSGVLHPFGISSTNWVITTPGTEDFLKDFTRKARKKTFD